MHDSDPLTLLDDIGQDTQSRSNTLVVPWTAGCRVNVNGAATVYPIDVRCVDHVLDLLDD